MLTAFNSGLSYLEYRKLIDSLLTENKTTGNDHSERFVEFTKLNVQRMNRIDKTVQLDEPTSIFLKQLKVKLKFLLIGDAWCGDCAQIIPVISKIADVSSNHIQLKIISRDLYPELIEIHHSNGAKAIPKLLVLNENGLKVVGTWGPRPKEAQAIMLHWKENKDKISWEDFEKSLHLWYARDRGQGIIDECVTLIKSCE